MKIKEYMNEIFYNENNIPLLPLLQFPLYNCICVLRNNNIYKKILFLY